MHQAAACIHHGRNCIEEPVQPERAGDRLLQPYMITTLMTTALAIQHMHLPTSTDLFVGAVIVLCALMLQRSVLTNHNDCTQTLHELYPALPPVTTYTHYSQQRPLQATLTALALARIVHAITLT